jgi:HEAT repeat protein
MKIITFITHTVLITVLMLGLTGCKRTQKNITKWKNEANTVKLTKALGDKDLHIRKAAATALGELETEQAVEPLATLLTDPYSSVRLSAIRALASIGNAPAQKHLIHAIKLDYDEGRACAIEALGSLKVSGAVDLLIEALDDETEKVAQAAAISLGQIASPKAVKPLSDKVQARSRELRLACMESLRKIGGAAAAEGLTPALDDMSKDIQQAAVKALVDIGQPSIPHAIGTLQSNSKIARKNAIAALQQLQAVPTKGSSFVWYRLAQVSTNPKKDIDPPTVEELANMGEIAIPALIDAVSHADSDIREHAFMALETIGQPCTDQLVQAAESHAGAEGKKWFNNRSNWYGAPCWRIDLWGAATALNPKFKLPARWEKQLQAGNIEALRQLSSNKFNISREYIPLLIHQLDPSGQNPSVNFFGISSGKKFYDSSQAKEQKMLAGKHLVSTGNLAVLPLIAALNSNNEQVVDSCAEALGKIGDKRAVQPLMQKLSAETVTTDNVTHSPCYLALLKLNSSVTISELRKTSTHLE